MTPPKSLLQIAIVLVLASGASALLAQNSSLNKVARAPQTQPVATEKGATSRSASAPRGATASLQERKGATDNASAAFFKAAPVRIAQAIAPGGAQPKTELSALEAQAAARREKSAREFMTARGFTDQATQDAIISYLQEQESAREALAEAGRSLAPALVSQNGALTDAQIETLVDGYQTQLKAYGRQNQQKQADLDAQIGFSKKPRLQAMLLLMGALDQGPRILPVWRPLRPEGVMRPRQPKPAV